MKSKPVKIIYGIIIPLMLLVIVLAILGDDWNEFSQIWIIWLFYLIIVLIVELHLFAPEEKIFSRMREKLKIKEIMRKIYPWLIRVLIVIIVLSIITFAIGFIISSMEISPDQIAIIDSESNHLFIDRNKLGNFKVTLKNNSGWSATDILMKTSIYYKGNDSLVVFLTSHILEDSRLRSNSRFTYHVCNYHPCKISNINHPPNKLFIYEFIDKSVPMYDLSKFLAGYREKYPDLATFDDAFVFKTALRESPGLAKINWVNNPTVIQNLYRSNWATILEGKFKDPPDYLFREGLDNKDWKFDKIYEELKKDNPEFYITIENKLLLDRDFYVKHEIISANRYSFLEYILDEFY